MVPNVMPITQDEPKPQAAGRLCNFKTGYFDLLPDHKVWLDHTVGRVLWDLKGTWVDLVGYASKLGNADFNKQLSARRVEEVKKYIGTLKKDVNFQQETALGEEMSGDDESNDDGYFRAVEVFVYGFAPPPLRPRLEGKKTLRKYFAIRVVSALSVGIGPLGGDALAFDIGEPTKGKWRRFIYLGGSGNFWLPKLKIPLPPLSSGFSGRSVPFSTSRPCEIEDFEGGATLFNGVGIALGPISVGGDMGLSIESSKLVSKMAVVSPKVIHMTNDTGLGISFGGAGKGHLQLL
jgi:hypothetical protein